MKKTLSDLAIFHGTPAFSEKLHVGRPNIGRRETLLERVNNILDNRWLTNRGPFEREFEQRIADLLGVKHCIAICNGTVALEIAIRGMGMSGEVIVPSFTFIATAHALQWQGIKPVFCDIDPDTHNIDPEQIERMITPRTTGIIGVHVWGRPCDIKALTEIANRNQLKLLFDAAHAFACSHEGQIIGNFGDAEVLSFHATKFVNTSEGGAVVTNDDTLADKIRLMKNFGFSGYDNVIYTGTNGKMSEISAAMGLTSLESMDDFISANYRNYKEYERGLSDIPGISLVAYNESEKSNYQYIVIEINETVTQISRDRLIDIFHAENVLARRYFYPGCHMMEPYRTLYPDAGKVLPETKKIANRIISLPTGTTILKEDIGSVCQIIQYVVENAAEIRKQTEHGYKASVRK
jgi:dTDP-4-amino-4,6-dideoxygalactose transaminase